MRGRGRAALYGPPAIVVLVMLLSIFAPDASAQFPPPPPPPPPPPSFTPRDPTPNPTGTAVIRGRVIRADTEQPLRRAQVRVTGGSLRSPVVATANVRGLYEIRDLPAGRYTVTAIRAGYLTMQNGQRYPREAGMPVEVANGAEMDVDFAMARASVVAGRVLDETGDEVGEATVSLLQPRWFEGQRKLALVGRAVSDDAGEYRVTNVQPGEYVVMATVREIWTARTPEPVVFGYAPSYYPSTANAAEAGRVQVGLGQEVSAVDITLVPGRTASVSGTALLSDGAPLGAGTLVLTQRISGPSGFSSMSVANSRVGPEGRWEFRNVPPGEYEISLTGGSSPGNHVATHPVVVAGVDLAGIVLAPSLPATISGVVRTDDGSALPQGPPLRVVPESLEPGRRRTTAASGDGAVAADGTFSAGGVPQGAVLLRRMALPPGWGVRSVIVNGRDHAEVPFQASSGQDLAKVEVVISRTLPVVSGDTVNEQGEADHGTVLLYPVDPVRWHEPSLHQTRADQRGTFRFQHIRPGEYFIVALDYVPTWQVTDPEYLDGLRGRSLKIRVVEGDNEPLRLRVVR